MKASSIVLTLAGVVACACSAPVPRPAPVPVQPAARPATTTYTNPVLDDDFADPAVLRSGDWFYAYATQVSSGTRRINIQGARSRDLVSWEPLGDVMPTKPTWASTTQDFWAPHVLHDRGTYYLYYSANPDSRDGMCMAVATSQSPAGPFRDVGKPMKCGQGFTMIDSFPFDDPKTGKKLMYWGSNSAPIVVQELAASRTELAPGTQPITLIRASDAPYEKLIEGPWITERDGFFYMFYSGDSCCGKTANYAVLVARATSPTGPFERRPGANAVILEKNAHWFAPGHNAVIRDDAGEDWMLYHAIDPRRPSQPCPADADGTQVLSCNAGGELPSRRPMLLDRITYRDGWPEMVGAPTTTPQRAPVIRTGATR